jgi:hypothetical protein
MMQALNNYPTNTIILMLGWMVNHFQENKRRLHLFIFYGGYLEKTYEKQVQIKQLVENDHFAIGPCN